jgi:hypothetical protein
MPRSRAQKRWSVPLATAGVASLILGSLSGTAAATSAKFDFVNDASYILTVRSAAAESYVNIPRYLPSDIGHSYVDLVHDIGAPEGRCEAIGAGYWLGTELEEAVLGSGFAPPDPVTGKAMRSGYKNPTIHRTVRPDLTPPGEENDLDKRPRIYNPADGAVIAEIPAEGNGPKWTSSCASGEKGEATGNILDIAGLKAAGSTTSAEVDRATGRYTATSRSYVTGLQGAGALDTFTSLMQVTNQPNRKPTITYRISFFNAATSKDDNRAGFDQEAITIAGQNVPADELVKQFNEQVAGVSAALAAVGPLGVSLLAPQTRTSTNGDQYEIVAPVLQVIGGAAARKGDIGEEVGLRLGSTAFTGLYGF